jgi:outer membrane protein assembly factor BamD (BamD/ComL family)
MRQNGTDSEPSNGRATHGRTGRGTRHPNLQFAICNLQLAVLAATLGGCAMFQKPSVSSSNPQPTPEQRDWWEANRHKAKYVPERGYYVEGVSGYFDENGRPLPSVSGKSGIEEDEDADRWISEKKLKSGMKKMVGRGLNEPRARSAFAEGERLFREGSYDQAAKQFFIAYDRWPDSPLEEDALYMSGEANFFADRYQAAEDAYGMLLKKYPSTTRLDKITNRRFAIGRYWELKHASAPHWPLTPNFADKTRPWFDTAGHAIKVYERIRLDDPTGPLADDATMATANYYFVNHRYEDADYYYGLVRSEFPKSEFMLQAHTLGLQAKLLKYQGPDYDGTPLKEADELTKTLLTQFPAELGAERERIVKVQAEVRRQQAHREYSLAEYYHKGKHYGASKMYYESIAKLYPETELAKQSIARIEEVRGQPDSPEDKFEWLTGMFPESKRLGSTIASRPSDTPSSTKRR